MQTKLERIAEISRYNTKAVFTSLYHLLNKELLMECHRVLDGKKAIGIDGVSKADYEKNLEENIDSLVTRLKNKAYKPMPSLRKYIPCSITIPSDSLRNCVGVVPSNNGKVF